MDHPAQRPTRLGVDDRGLEEWAKRQAAKAGLRFTALDNGFAAVDDVDRLQAICDSLGPVHIDALLRKWLRILPNPFTDDDQAAGTRIPGLRFGDIRVHALLQALLIHRLLPNGFTNRDLRSLIAPLLGTTIEDITAGKMTYDLRRLRMHGLIARIPHTRRYQVTDAGLRDALLFTHAHDHLLRTAMAELTDPDPPWPSQLRAAARAYQAAFDKLAHRASLAA